MWKSPGNEGAGNEAAGSEAVAAVLGTVVGVDGAQVTVEVIGAGGAAAIVQAPAIHHAPYQVNDRVLVLFQGRNPETAVVAGRVGVVEDAVDATSLLRADGSMPLTNHWDTGGGVHIALEELRARASNGLLLADMVGSAGVFVADGGSVGIGTLDPEGVLHLWDGVAGHIFTSHSGVTSTARIIVAAGAVTQFARVDLLISNGTARTFLSFSMQVGGAMAQSITTGSDTWQVRLNGDGSLDVRRTAGSGTATVVVRCMWI